MSANDGNRIQSIDLMGTYAHGTRRYVVCKKEEVKSYTINSNNNE